MDWSAMMRAWRLAWVAVAMGCSTDLVPQDASPDAMTADGGGSDAGASDAGRLACPTAGAHAEQVIEVEGESRFYYLYVPEGVDCTRPVSLWVDFHGTAQDRPEEAYGLAAQVALADREGFVLVRPRSRFSSEGGVSVYRWDQNPGDLERNVRFTEALVELLARTFTVDPERLYASGFSSGSNMTARFLGETSIRFRGFGPIAGGIFSDAYPLRSWAGESFRVYASTGHRDYLHFALDSLLDALAEGGVDDARVFVREADTGHELYDLQFEEMWAFFRDGTRPAEGSLRSPWRREATGTSRSLLDVERDARGELLAVGAAGTLLSRTTEGTWTPAPGSAAGGPGWTDACFTGDGHALVVGEGQLATRSEGGAFTVRPGVLPELGERFFGYAYINGVGCGAGGDALLGGYWSALRTSDAGATFADVSIDFGGYAGQVAAVVARPEGAWAVGYYGVARGASELSAVSVPEFAGSWMLDVNVTAAGTVLLVDDHGEIFRSTDGTSFVRVVPSDPRGLYAITSLGAEVMAVGAGGRALYSRDDGATYISVDTGLDGFLGGVTFLAPGEVIAVGEAGAALHFTAGGA